MYHFIVPLNVVGMLVPLPMNAVTYGDTVQVGEALILIRQMAILMMGIRTSTRWSSAVTLFTMGLGVRFMLTALWLMAMTPTLGASPWATLLSSLRIEVIVAVMMVL